MNKLMHHFLAPACAALLMLGSAAFAQNTAPAPATVAPQATVPNASSAPVIASIRQVSGTVHVHDASGRFILAFEGSVFHAGDRIVTEDNSSALLVFSDGSQTALRAKTEFLVSSYRFSREAPKSDSMIVNLLKGGLRVISGLISKRGNKDAYEFRTTTASIGIRGTDFIAHLCEDDCTKEQVKTTQVVSSSAMQQSGRVAIMNGVLTATNVMGVQRYLTVGSAFFENDLLEMSGGRAVIVMTDGTRMTMEGGSRFINQKYRYNAKEPKKSEQLFTFLKGVLRVVTGALAKKDPQKVNFNAITATIGVRGTAFDLVCHNDPDKETKNANGETIGPNECGAALYVSMRDGKTEVQNGAGAITVSKGQTVLIDSASSVPIVLQNTPDFISTDPTPTPESESIDMGKLFGRNADTVQPGLYVEVVEGQIVLRENGQEVLIGKGDTGFAPITNGAPALLNTTPAFMDSDPTLASFPFANTSMCMAQ